MVIMIMHVPWHKWFVKGLVACIFMSWIGLGSAQVIPACHANYMGHWTSGILASPNFPFLYYPHLESRHRIFLGHPTNGNIWRLCFNFRRFNLGTDNFCVSDYLKFPGPDRSEYYCSDGRILQNSSAPNNVFLENFCWHAVTETTSFTIEFKSGSNMNSGFYATFEISQFPKSDSRLVTPPVDENVTDVALPNDTDHFQSFEAPCLEEDYVCFNRRCIPFSQKCDSINHCLDNSDEDYAHAKCSDKQDIRACDFESSQNGFCGMESTRFTRRKFSDSGLQNDHTTRDGYFIYSDYKDPSVVATTARVEYTKLISVNTGSCLRFWYHMLGEVGKLDVYMDTSAPHTNPSAPAWSRHGDQGDQWLLGEIALPATLINKITFETEKGNFAFSNIALDDISIIDGPCYQDDLSCTFQLGFCDFQNEGTNKWLRWTGPTPNPDTGPSTGVGGDPASYYIYMDGLGYQNQKARLISRPVPNGRGSVLHCIYFWYNLYGRSMGSLSVKIKDEDGLEKSVFYISGDQGFQWHKVAVPIFVQGAYQIIFEAIPGSSSLSDIAIDEIHLTHRGCSHETTTSVPTSPGPAPTCWPGDFQCDDGSCIDGRYRCDGSFDCVDRSDEKNCKSVSVGAVVGGVVAAFFCATFLVLGNAMACRRRQQRRLRERAQRERATQFNSSVYDNISVNHTEDGYSTLDNTFNRSGIFHEPPPAYSPQGADSVGHAALGPSLTISLMFPSEPPPSYDIAIIASPTLPPNYHEISNRPPKPPSYRERRNTGSENMAFSPESDYEIVPIQRRGTISPRVAANVELRPHGRPNVPNTRPPTENISEPLHDSPQQNLTGTPDVAGGSRISASLDGETTV